MDHYTGKNIVEKAAAHKHGWWPFVFIILLQEVSC